MVSQETDAKFYKGVEPSGAPGLRSASLGPVGIVSKAESIGAKCIPFAVTSPAHASKPLSY